MPETQSTASIGLRHEAKVKKSNKSVSNKFSMFLGIGRGEERMGRSREGEGEGEGEKE